AGGLGRETAFLIDQINSFSLEWNLLGFIDDSVESYNTSINGHYVIGNTEWLSDQECYYVIAIANPNIKENIYKKLSKTKLKLATLIHPAISIAPSVQIGEGTIITNGNFLTINIKIGKNVLIDYNCFIGHDAVISDFCTLYPSVNVSGFYFLSEGVSMGVGSAIIQQLSIGKFSTIGAGATVTKSIPDRCTAVGTPAKPIKYSY